MGLAYYDSDKVAVGADPVRTFHDGFQGGSNEQLIYIRNDDPAVYYTNMSVSPQMLVYQDWGEFGATGWGIKTIYGERRPTEAEWSVVHSGDRLMLPDIGTSVAADMSTYTPIWVRVYCPGAEPAQIRDNIRLRLSFVAQLVTG